MAVRLRRAIWSLTASLVMPGALSAQVRVIHDLTYLPGAHYAG